MSIFFLSVFFLLHNFINNLVTFFVPLYAELVLNFKQKVFDAGINANTHCF